MKILWISNILFDDIADAVNTKRAVGGGWLQSLLLILKNDIQIGIVSLFKSNYTQTINDISYYLLTSINKESWEIVLNEFKPDLIHIHGTEYPHTLKIKQLSHNIPCVASIQGLVSIYSRFALGGLTIKDILRHTTIKDILQRTSPLSIKNSQAKRGKTEKKLICNLDHIIGRTQWDYDHSISLNPLIIYHKCNEVIRDTFYKGEWRYENAIPHSLFCSNSSVPLKGIHQVIKALQLVLKIFPDTKLRIAGKNILGSLSYSQRIKLSGYDYFLRRLIYKLKLENNIVFLGSLTAEEMKREFLCNNVFILPSAIENSPNSLGESQLLGTPVIASYVGGIPDMMPYPLSKNLYRFEEVEMLAQKIIETFKRKEWDEYINISKDIARVRHSQEAIKQNMIDIYTCIIVNQNKKSY